MDRAEQIHQRFHVPFDYPVVFTKGVFQGANPALAEAISRGGDPAPSRVLAFVDDGLIGADSQLPTRMERWFSQYGEIARLAAPPRAVPGGEAMKNDYRLLMEVVDMILEFRLCRHSVILVVGGGAVLDAVGFGASIVHRGLRVVRVPTTVLAQSDAGIGVKNGMNLHGGKNTIGTFHPPFAVLNDAVFLRSLPWRHWIAGVSEAFKVALIKDAVFFETLCRAAPALRRRDEDVMETIVRRCAALHLDHIRTQGDPFEWGPARPLDFGHWAAHRLESMTNYALVHGEAVAIGIALDTLYAGTQGWIRSPDAAQLLTALDICGLPLSHPAMERRLGDGTLELLSGLEDFREHLGGQLCVTFPRGIGDRIEVNHVDGAEMTRLILHLAEKANV